MLLNLSRNARLVEPVLTNTTSIGQSTRDDAKFYERSHILMIFANSRAYQSAILTCKFVNMG